MKRIFMMRTFNNTTASSNDTEKEDISVMFYKTGFNINIYIYIYSCIINVYLSEIILYSFIAIQFFFD